MLEIAGHLEVDEEEVVVVVVEEALDVVEDMVVDKAEDVDNKGEMDKEIH